MSKLFFIGEDCLYQGKVHHIQDVNRLDCSLKIGIVDEHGFVWEPFWVFTNEVERLEND